MYKDALQQNTDVIQWLWHYLKFVLQEFKQVHLQMWPTSLDMISEMLYVPSSLPLFFFVAIT